MHYIDNRVICAIVRGSYIEFLFKRIDEISWHGVAKFIHNILREDSCSREKSNLKVQDNNCSLLGVFKALFNWVILREQEEIQDENIKT